MPSREPAIRKGEIVAKQRTLLAIIVVFMALIAAGGGEALACSCRPYESTEHAFRQADVVFVGRVANLTSFDVESQTSTRAELTVRKIWKGEGREITVLTAGSTAACGFPFEKGQQYLIFAYDTGENVSTNLCSGSKNLSQAGHEIMDLNDIEAKAKSELQAQ